MKLWQKDIVNMHGCVVSIVGVCSTLLLLLSRNNILKLTIDSISMEQSNLKTSFKEMISYYG